MLIVVIGALGLIGGIPMVVLGIGALWWAGPLWVMGGLAGLAVIRRLRSRSELSTPDDEAALLRAVSSELAAGASLRSALVAASRSSRIDVSSAAAAAQAGLPAARVAAALQPQLHLNGRTVAGAWVLASESGAPASAVMRSMAIRAARIGDLARERRALTAQAKASAWVVAGLPLLLLGASLVSGRLTVGSDPVLAVIVVVGVTLQLLGVAVAVTMMRSVAR